MCHVGKKKELIQLCRKFMWIYVTKILMLYAYVENLHGCVNKKIWNEK